MVNQSTIDPAEVWTAAEAAVALKVDRKTLYALLNEKVVPGAAKIGRQWRILRRPFLNAWLSGNFRDLADLHNND